MRSIRTSLGLAVAALAVMTAGARGDWNPGDPAKWAQLPDLSSTGMDVYDARYPLGFPSSPTFKLLADDWRCTSVDPVTDIHIWGSWLNNHLPFGTQPFQGNPAAVTFKLSIHSDVPAGVGGVSYSHPGPQLWSAITTASAVRLYAPTAQFPGPINEQFYDPTEGSILGSDNQVWQYNFTNLPSPFIQLGTPAAPIIYWLDVQALSDDSTATFGWKTAVPPHQLDDAVWADTNGFGGPLMNNFSNPGGLPWKDLHYPNGPFAGQSFDLSFVITSVPEPATLSGLLMGALALFTWRRRTA
jgi:PEP-CTERM motif